MAAHKCSCCARNAANGFTMCARCRKKRRDLRATRKEQALKLAALHTASDGVLVPLTNATVFALVDKDVAIQVLRWTWGVDSNGYAHATASPKVFKAAYPGWTPKGRAYLHSFVSFLSGGPCSEANHIVRDARLDDRRSNLTFGTKSDNIKARYAAKKVAP